MPGEVNGRSVSGKSLAKLNPKMEVAPKSRVEEIIEIKEDGPKLGDRNRINQVGHGGANPVNQAVFILIVKSPFEVPTSSI